MIRANKNEFYLETFCAVGFSFSFKEFSLDLLLATKTFEASLVIYFAKCGTSILVDWFRTGATFS